MLGLVTAETQRLKVGPIQRHRRVVKVFRRQFDLVVHLIRRHDQPALPASLAEPADVVQVAFPAPFPPPRLVKRVSKLRLSTETHCRTLLADNAAQPARRKGDRNLRRPLDCDRKEVTGA